MKIGILADIHEHVENLCKALEIFQAEQIDKVILLGDIFETGKRIHDVVRRLSEKKVEGVWGNHELGFCHDPAPDIIHRYPQEVTDFFATLTPSLEIRDVMISHGMPNWDATDPSVYYLGPAPWQVEGLASVFGSFSHRVFLIGHFHRWYLTTAKAPVEWDGASPIVFDPDERYLLVVGAVADGWCATLETRTDEFTPHYLG